MKKEADRDIEFLCDETVMETRTVQERMLYNRLLARTAVGMRSVSGITTSFNDSLLNLKKRMGSKHKLWIPDRNHRILLVNRCRIRRV